MRREIPDGLLPGFYLIVQPSGAKSFAVRYRHSGIPRKFTIGAWPTISLEAARDLGAKALRAVAEGRDPAREKQAARADALRQAAEQARSQRDRYEIVAREFIERHARKNNRATTWQENARILGLRPSDEMGEYVEIGGDVMSAWHGLRIQEIAKRDVIALLDSIVDRGAPIMANRTLAAVRKLFNWALSRDIVAFSPCAGVAAPAKANERKRKLDDDEVKLLWGAAEDEGWPYGPIIKLLILTGQREGEVGGMCWDEIDVEKKVWTIPPARAKNGEQHQVPLSPAALRVIESVPRIVSKRGFVFVNARGGAVTSFSRLKERLDAAIQKSQEEYARNKPFLPWVLHDIRRTAASGMAKLGIRIEITEKVLNHRSGSFKGIVSVYQQHDFATEKRAALDAWAAHVEAIVAGKHEEPNVVLLRASTGA
jgi:integrase